MSGKPQNSMKDDADDGFEVVPDAAGGRLADDDAFDLDELVKKGSGKSAPAASAPRGGKRARAEAKADRSKEKAGDDEEEFVGTQSALPAVPVVSEADVAPETKRQRRKDAYRKRQQELEAETRQLSQSAVTCLLCGEEGHLSCDCPTHARNRAPAVPEGRRRTRSIRCHLCGRNGHMAKDCPQAQSSRRGGGRGGFRGGSRGGARGGRGGRGGGPRRGGHSSSDSQPSSESQE